MGGEKIVSVEDRYTCDVPLKVKKRSLSHALLGRQAGMHTTVREGSVKTIASRLLVNVLMEGVAGCTVPFPKRVLTVG
jgi:hypothetical protein